MVALPTLQFIVMYIGVNFNSVLLAFQEYDPATTAMKFIGFENFKRFFMEYQTTTIFSTALKNSLVAAIFTVGVNIALTVIFSLYIYHQRFAHKIFKVILFIPSIVSSIVMVKVYAMFCDGAIPELIKILFGKEIHGLLADVKTRWASIIFFNIWSGFGSSILIYVGAMNNISESVFEAAKLDGANVIQETWHITLPLIYPTTITYVTAGLAGIFTNQLGLYSFYGDSADTSLYTLGYWFYREVSNANGVVAMYPYISAVGLLCTIVCVPLVLFARWLMNKLGPKTE